MNGQQRQERLQRLAARVSVGEVVFFIGAGFSLDAEGNSAKVLIARLLVRFEALCKSLGASRRSAQSEGAIALRLGLRRTFGLHAPTDAPDAVNDLFDAKIDDHLHTLAQSYFQINDWLCTAFDELLRLLVAHKPARLNATVQSHEKQLLEALHRHDKWKDTTLHLGALDLDLLLPFWRYCDEVPVARTERALAGKVLFLDTMGFDDPAVMAGAPMSQDMQAVLSGTEGRLSERHHALAWLAAEGLCPVVVTTNFDLLLESSYRLAGLLPWNAPARDWPDGRPQVDGGLAIKVPRNRRYSHFARIAEAWQFFSHTQALRAAHLYKIHGCADAYRSARRLAVERGRDGGGYATLRDLLPTIVFTYREIQNWRQDTWSRDHLSTLLRTRTIVFSGYSVADPVIHDTFRNIYEEMASLRLTARQSEEPAQRANAAAAASGPLPATGLELALPTASNVKGNNPGGEAAPAFVLALEAEFYGMQILRAASMAAGMRRPKVADHPNLLSFYLRKAQLVPTLDELYVLLYHECVRELQAQALQTQLLHAFYRLAGHRTPSAEADAIGANFKVLRAYEADEAAAVLDGAADPALRHRFRRLTGWTWHFHRQLMREYGLAESFLRHPTEALSVERVARLPWYCPMSEHADWTAWSVVVELAIRRAHASLSPPGTHHDLRPVRPMAHSAAAVDFVQGGVKRALTIELASMRRVFMRPLPRPLRALRPMTWELRNETVPWWREGDLQRPLQTPSARTLWQWAALPPSEWLLPASTYFCADGSVA